MSPPELVLASQSPRRSQLLTMLGLEFAVSPADVDETYAPGEEAGAHAERLAREKAAKIAVLRDSAIVVGSDTVVVIDGDVLGKPRNKDEAVAMLMRLQGRSHEVATGVAVSAGGETHSSVVRVTVTFRAFDEAIARAYVETGEPMDKAGAYGIQGFGATIVDRIDGDFFAVMGFPIVAFIQLLERHGWHYDFGRLQRAAANGSSSR
ncbi:MAG: Maf family protein [Longimicrobiales bacterium]